MNYEEFKDAFMTALKACHLPTIGFGKETLDLRSTARVFTVGVEPLDRDIGRPFHVSAAISFRWDSLQTARTATCEEDVVGELLGEGAQDEETERPWLRVDIELRAGLECVIDVAHVHGETRRDRGCGEGRRRRRVDRYSRTAVPGVRGDRCAGCGILTEDLRPRVRGHRTLRPDHH
jgi:hypothetical protein